MQSTKALNKLIKKRGITKERAKQIKQERRTLKNRGNILISAGIRLTLKSHALTKVVDFCT